MMRATPPEIASLLRFLIFRWQNRQNTRDATLSSSIYDDAICPFIYLAIFTGLLADEIYQNKSVTNGLI